MKEKIEQKLAELKKDNSRIEEEIRNIDKRRSELIKLLIENNGAIKTLQEFLIEKNN